MSIDDIGNLKTRTERDMNQNPFETVFTADNHNQYDSRTRTRTHPDPARRVIKGLAPSGTTVTISQQSPQPSTATPINVLNFAWYGDPSASSVPLGYGGQASASVTNGPAVLDVTTTATRTVSGTPRSITKTGKLFLPPKNEDLSYDLNGNLTAGAQWVYTWDAEPQPGGRAR